jgi:hypothetical protein
MRAGPGVVVIKGSVAVLAVPSSASKHIATVVAWPAAESMSAKQGGDCCSRMFGSTWKGGR